MKKYICRSPGCNRLLESPGYCEEHIIREKDKPFNGAIRYNEKLYNTTRWRNLRKEHLKENDYCQECGLKEDLTVDHKISPLGNEELFFDPDNLQTLCKKCHRIKTANEINERKLKK
jgi:5-methylcytosine-specific restriction protein A